MASATNTARGLWWIIVGFLVALANVSLVLAVGLAFSLIPGFGLDLAQRAVLGYFFVFVTVGALAVGSLGIRALGLGKREMGPPHAAAMGYGFRAVLVAGVSGAAFLIVSIVVSLVPLGNPQSPLGGAVSETILLDARAVAGLTIAVSLGMFLFWTIRDLGTAETTFLAGAALALGVVSGVPSLFRVDFGLPTLMFNLASLGLWTAAYLATWFRINRNLPEDRSGPAAA